MKTINKKTFKTADLGLAASLCCFTNYISIEKDPIASKVYFIFAHSKESDRIVEAYWLGKLTIEPQDFLIRLKRLKNIIHDYES